MMIQIKEEERSQREWNRKAKDVINMITRRLLGAGTTAQRPGTPTDGQMFYDCTLKKPIWWNTADAQWKDATGTGV